MAAGRHSRRMRDSRPILVIDDDPDILDSIVGILAQAGYTTIAARDGVEALIAARANPPALVLLDVMMPLMDGWDFLRLLREDTVLHDVPVVVVTATDIDDDRGRADAFLLKPFRLDHLLALVRRFCGAPSLLKPGT